MKLNLIIGFAFISINIGSAQIYKDYIGAGHSAGITVTTSSDMNNNTGGIKTIDGSGLDNPRMEASRFLAQAAVGYESGHINDVVQLGFEGWIDNQFTRPLSPLTPKVWTMWQDIKQARADQGLDTTDLFGPYDVHYNYMLWTEMMLHEDLLRHRVAQALSEIVVISRNSDIGAWAEGMAGYHDILLNHSFGNYKDVLLNITKSPMMGYYLSHLNNPKTDLVNNIRPDENFAREIMQLFTIGLHKLNINGTPARDANGNLIPTYDNVDIKEMAKVFSGLGGGQLSDPTEWPYVPTFGVGLWAYTKTHPMIMFQSEHESGPKVLLKDITININGNGMAEIDAAVNYLFNHPNTGPFISHKLIQRLVKSNPSPAYIQRVAQVFNNNGSGVRGDMKAIIKAILLDEEARNGEYMALQNAGMVRPPFLKYTQFMRQADIDVPTGRYWNNGFTILEATGHWPLSAPSVFNFYLPNHQPVGEIADAGLFSPELKLHNTSSAVRYVNNAFSWMYWGSCWWDWEPEEVDNPAALVTEDLEAMADDIEKMINHLDINLTHGQLTETTRQNMRDALTPIYWTWNQEWRYHRARMLLYTYLISPDFNVIK